MLASSGMKRFILLVDDHPDEITQALRALEANKLSVPVVVMRDGVEALDFLFGTGAHAGRDLQATPQAVLLDLRIPGLEGLELLRRIRTDERTRLLPVVILTVSGDERDVAASYLLGANSYIRKPADAQQLAEAVKLVGSYWMTLNAPPLGEWRVGSTP